MFPAVVLSSYAQSECEQQGNACIQMKQCKNDLKYAIFVNWWFYKYESKFKLNYVFYYRLNHNDHYKSCGTTFRYCQTSINNNYYQMKSTCSGVGHLCPCSFSVVLKGAAFLPLRCSSWRKRVRAVEEGERALARQQRPMATTWPRRKM